MRLTDTQLTYFVDNRLRLPKDLREKHLGQVRNMIEEFSRAAEDDDEIAIRRFRIAGSLMKGTSLLPRDGVSPDADVAVFLDGEVDDFDLDGLHERIRQLLVKSYPSKKPGDFTVQPRTLGIVFQGSGLEVDLVPIIPDPDREDYGFQPSSRGEPPILTSVVGQLEFVKTRKESDKRYGRLVRLVKHWRNFKEIEYLRSFPIELLLARLQDRDGPAETLEQGLVRFFGWVAQSELKERVTFAECGSPKTWPEDPVVVLDPVNCDNNVTRRLSDPERREVVAAGLEAWERLHEARNNDYTGETLECWKDVFGRSFVVGD